MRATVLPRAASAVIVSRSTVFQPNPDPTGLKKWNARALQSGIAVASPPESARPARPSAVPQYLPLSLVDLARELHDLAQADWRFDRASSLATELEEELRRLSSEEAGIRARRPRRPLLGRLRRTPVQARLLETLQAECVSLRETVQRLEEQGITLSTEQLSDLRLGERTRRVFHEAGLLFVQDVADLTPERAAEIPQLAPTSVAELRAALMFALDSAGGARPPMLSAPGVKADLFDGIAHSVNRLPAREREVVVLRNGVGDRVHDRDEVASQTGVSVDQVDQLERHALNTLLSNPAAVEACWRLEDLCTELGLAWDDERLPTAIAAKFPNTRVSFTRLVTWLIREKGRLTSDAAGREFRMPGGIAHFEEMVVATLGRYGELSATALTTHVRAALTPDDLDVYPAVDVAGRVQALGPAVQVRDGVFYLPDAPVPGIDDRNIRALNGLIGALQKLGAARIASLTVEVNKRLPRAYQVNEDFVKTWLTKHPELFSRADSERFKLASMDVDILCGLATRWRPDEGAVVASARQNRATGRLNDRVAAEITELLRREGPLSIGRIRAHLYGRFIGHASADVIIAQHAHKFIRQKDGTVSLRAEDDGGPTVVDAPPPPAPPRTAFWQRR